MVIGSFGAATSMRGVQPDSSGNGNGEHQPSFSLLFLTFLASRTAETGYRRVLLKPGLQVVSKAQAAPEGKDVLVMGIVEIHGTAFAIDPAGPLMVACMVNSPSYLN